jgi:hypothetical protein
MPSAVAVLTVGTVYRRSSQRSPPRGVAVFQAVGASSRPCATHVTTLSLPSRGKQVDEGRLRSSAGLCGSGPVGFDRCGCCTSLLHLADGLTFQCQFTV